MHAPLQQICPAGQAWPQVPQCAGSVWTSTHMPPQQTCPGWAGMAARSAVRRVGLQVGARPTAAAFSGAARVDAGPAVRWVGLEIGACAAATGLPGGAGTAIEGAPTAVGRAAALPGLACQRRAADALVADLAGGTGGIAGPAVRRVGLDVDARSATADPTIGARGPVLPAGRRSGSGFGSAWTLGWR